MPLKMHQDEMPGINLAPMVDVLCQLVLFFLVGASFTDSEQQLDLTVPSVNGSAKFSEAPQKCLVNVYRDGRIEFNKQIVSLDELVERLAASRKAHGSPSVVVRGDAEGAFQNVASVLTACRSAGIAEMGISVRIASQERSLK